MKKTIVNICRLLLAVVFILSGFVKAIDPLGTQYKIEDYLEAMHLSGLVPDLVTLGASVLQSAVEFCLGMLLLFAIQRKLVSQLVLLVMLVMTPLTLWLAIANPISDCGCFGDAVVLTNWQTFWKNVILLVAAIVVAKWPTQMFRFVSESNQWIVINYTAVFIVIVSAWSLYDLPLFDFRPYHVGANIKEGMEIPEGAELPEFETTFILQKDGEQREFTLNDYPDSTWTFVDSRTVQTRQGYVPPIHDFVITTLPLSDKADNDQPTEEAEGDDITEEVLSDEGYTFLLISPHLENADDSRLDLINELYDYAQQQGYPYYCLTASTMEGINRWRDMTGAEYPFCQTDATTLKTIIRSNPGLVLLKNGTVIRKWSHNNLPVIEEAQKVQPLEGMPIGHLPDDTVAGKILQILLWFVLPLALLTIADRLWMWTNWVRRRPQTSTPPSTHPNDPTNNPIK